MPFESLGAVSCSSSIVTMAVSVVVCEIFSVKDWCDLENWLGFVQGHWKWHHLIVSKAYDFLFTFHSNYDRIFSHFGYSASKNGVALKCGFGVVQDH